MRSFLSGLRQSQHRTAVAIASPVVACLLASGAFVAWQGVTSARSIETTQVRGQSENVILLSGYLQQLVADCRANAKLVVEALPDSADVTNAVLIATAATFHSKSHLPGVVIAGLDGRTQATSGVINAEMAARLPEITRRLATGEGEVLVPIAANDERTDTPDFLFAARLPGRPLAVIIHAASQIDGRPMTFRMADIDEPFALIDTIGGGAVPFGTAGDADWLDGAKLLMAKDSDRGNKVEVRCEGSVFLERRCIVYKALANSPFVIAGLVSGGEFRAAWIQANRPFWLFALVVMAGGAASAGFIHAWTRQRRTDRSALGTALAELTRAYAAKSNFMAHLSHELRTPLNSILGFSDLIRSGQFGPLSERYRAYADDIHISALHLNTIAADIMDLERLERGEAVLEAGNADLNEAAAEAVRMLGAQAAQRLVTVAIKPWPAPALVPLTSHRATQIALNLISNAVKYSEPGDHVVITVDRPQGAFVLTVADEGIGMTATEIGYTERPFGQPAERRSARHDSVGLGLPIVRGLLGAIGGKLAISSEKFKGTTVAAVFGAVAEAPARQGGDAAPAALRAAAG